MTPEQILEYPARVLSQTQRESYFEQGYLCVQSFAESEWLSELLRITAAFVDASRDETQSGDVIDIAPEHSPEKPKLRRLKMPDDRHQGYWDFVNGPLAEVAADLLGPDVVFHHSKLNFKWYDESDQVRWHQDAQFFPHTNYNVLTIGTYLADTDMNNGPLAVIPGQPRARAIRSIRRQRPVGWSPVRCRRRPSTAGNSPLPDRACWLHHHS